jgi:hypothetical protein
MPKIELVGIVSVSGAKLIFALSLGWDFDATRAGN